MSGVFTPRLRAAAEYIKIHGWTTGTEKNGDGQVCLTGAVRYCQPQNGDEYLIRAVLRKRGRAEDWNDTQATEEEVIAYLATTDITDEDLVDAFGPQALDIVAQIRVSYTLTPAHWDRLDAAWAAAWAAARDAARDAAWAAARDAAWAAARDAAWAAARDAAWAAARDAAWAAARDAAVALVIRDLIGQHGFTQEHYDKLTGPWRKTVGKLHADDLDIFEADDFTGREASA